MNRRNFVKIIGAGGAAMAFTGVTTQCVESREYDIPEEWKPENSEMTGDYRFQLLKYAILAPNPHNKQPWKIDLTKPDIIRLFIDEERLLPQTDPFSRQIYIGQGTFIETLVIASSEYGYFAEVKLLPEGEDESVGKKPVADIILSKGVIKKDPLFNYITIRATNRLVYSDRSIEQNILEKLKTIGDEQYPIELTTQPEILTNMADLMTEAMHKETYIDRTHKETVDMIRFNETEVNKIRDGFGFKHLGVHGIGRFFAEHFSSPTKAFETNFRKRTVDGLKEMVHSAKAIGILYSYGNDRIQQIESGRKFVRIHLTATQNHIAFHPMSQVLQEYEEMQTVNRKFSEIISKNGYTPQMSFRLGYADSVPHTRRRSVHEMIKIS